jgi:predicted ester cyclase
MTDLIPIASRIPLEVFGAGRLDLLDDLLADDYAVRVLSSEHEGGAEVLRALVHRLRSAFPDLSYAVDDAVQGEDTVALRVTASGTQTGQLLDLPPTGHPASWTEMHFLRFSGERIAEHWGVADEYHVYEQLAVPSHVIPRAHQAITGAITIPDEAFALAEGYESYLR